MAAAAVQTLSCASAGGRSSSSDSGLPDVGYLRTRVERLYTAEQAKDWQTWYSLAGPDLKTEKGSKEFWGQVAKPRDISIRSWRIRGVRALDKEELPAEADAAAAVAMDVMVDTPAGPIHKQENQTDYWVHIKGEWYWAWRGWPDD